MKQISRIAILLFFSVIAFQMTYCMSLQPANKVPDHLLVKNFIRLSISEFQKATDTHLNFFQKMYFKKLQKKLTRTHTMQNATILPYYDVQKKKFKFDPLWFILGTIIGPFALLFAFTSRQPKNKRISALIGFGVFILWFGWLFLF